MTDAQISDLRYLLMLARETPRETDTAYGLVVARQDAAITCDQLLHQALSALVDNWKEAQPFIEQLEKVATQHELGFYILQAESLRYACTQKKLFDRRQVKF